MDHSPITSDQTAFLGSLKFVRFALVVLVSICKKYAKWIQNLTRLAELAVGIRKQLPPSPSSHNLGPSSVEAFSAIIPALETIFKVLLVAPNVSDDFRWEVFQLFRISRLEDISLFPAMLDGLENLQYLNSLLSTNVTLSASLLEKINSECIPWVFNGLLVFSADVLYSSNQLCKASKTPLYTKTFIALASFLVRCSQQRSLASSVSWILNYALHPHYLCNLMASDLWKYLVRRTTAHFILVDVTKQLVSQLILPFFAKRTSTDSAASKRSDCLRSQCGKWTCQILHRGDIICGSRNIPGSFEGSFVDKKAYLGFRPNYLEI